MNFKNTAVLKECKRFCRALEWPHPLDAGQSDTLGHLRSRLAWAVPLGTQWAAGWQKQTNVTESSFSHGRTGVDDSSVGRGQFASSTLWKPRLEGVKCEWAGVSLCWIQCRRFLCHVYLQFSEVTGKNTFPSSTVQEVSGKLSLKYFCRELAKDYFKAIPKASPYWETARNNI